ncbi:MAG: lysophospholipid acyltransferase family protein [Alphaproteobacteria bacterium]
MIKKFLKQISRNERLRQAACWLVQLYIRLVMITTRWERIGFENPQRLLNQGKPFIVTFWHGRLMMMPFTWFRGYPFHMLISTHGDGLFIARTVSYFGIETIEGSSRRGGLDAVKAMVRRLRAGEAVGITPDGPHGPRMQASDGAIRVARLAGVPILPATTAVRLRKVMNTWDRFLIALPFSRGVMIWGNAIEIPADADDQTIALFRQRLEEIMNDQAAQADHHVGATPIMPAPPGTLPTKIAKRIATP